SQDRSKYFPVGMDPGKHVLGQFVAEFEGSFRFFRVTSRGLREKCFGRTKHIGSLFRWNEDFKKYQQALRDDRSRQRLDITDSMLEVLQLPYWSQQARRQQIRKQVETSKMFAQFEEEIGYRQALKSNPKLKLVIFVGNMAFS